jgi:hypothetical protein
MRFFATSISDATLSDLIAATGPGCELIVDVTVQPATSIAGTPKPSPV